MQVLPDNIMRIIAAGGIVLGLVGCAPAAVYYVDQSHPSADDANPGTDPAAPWATLGKSFAAVVPGDTVYVKGDADPNAPAALYDRSGRAGLAFERAGTAAAPIRFAAWEGDAVIIQGDMTDWGIDLTHASHHRIEGFVIRGFAKAAEGWSGASDVVIENCEFTQTTETGLRLRDVSDFVLRDCHVHHCWETGVSIRRGVGVTVERVESSYNDDGQGTAGDGDGFATNQGDDITFIDCVARGNSEDGFDLSSDCTVVRAVAAGNAACNIKLWRRDADGYAPKTMTIVNSLIYDAGQAGLKASRGPALRMFHCTVWGNGEEGIAFRGIDHSVGPARVDSEIVNCILADNGWGAIEVRQSGPNVNHVVADHNLYYRNGRDNMGLAADTNRILGHPKLLDPDAGDFHIPSDSAARDQGATLGEVTEDFEGQRRPGGAAYDVGADEYYPPATVAGRFLFYNNSAFDGNDPAANAADDAAIAPDKTALLGGQAAGFANYSSYTRGINGVMIDIADLPAAPTAADFELRVGNDDRPGTWAPAPAPAAVAVRFGAGVGGADRVSLLWADGSISGEWLEVCVLPTVRTGLAAADVFYFGNAVGETGNRPDDAKVTPTDVVSVRNHPHTPGQNPAPIDAPWDFNRDQKVGPTDEVAARDHGTNAATALQLITPP